MSTIITGCTETGMLKIKLLAERTRTVIVNTNIRDTIIEIEGSPGKPFIIGVRFIDCTITADNLRSFDSCMFESGCTLNVKDLPKVKGSAAVSESINLNVICGDV